AGMMSPPEARYGPRLQPRSQTMPHTAGGGPPGGRWNPNMAPPRRQGTGPSMASPSMGMGMGFGGGGGGRSQSPGYHPQMPPPQGQYTPPLGRPGTPGRMPQQQQQHQQFQGPFQGQAS